MSTPLSKGFFTVSHRSCQQQLLAVKFVPSSHDSWNRRQQAVHWVGSTLPLVQGLQPFASTLAKTESEMCVLGRPPSHLPPRWCCRVLQGQLRASRRVAARMASRQRSLHWPRRGRALWTARASGWASRMRCCKEWSTAAAAMSCSSCLSRSLTAPQRCEEPEALSPYARSSLDVLCRPGSISHLKHILRDTMSVHECSSRSFLCPLMHTISRFSASTSCRAYLVSSSSPLMASCAAIFWLGWICGSKALGM